MSQVCIREFADPVQINTCREMIQQLNPSINKLTKILNLAGNEVRYKILYLLHTENKLCVCDMSDILEMNVSAVSQHLRKLKDGNIIDSNKEAQTVFYYINPDMIDVIESLFSFIKSKNEVGV